MYHKHILPKILSSLFLIILGGFFAINASESETNEDYTRPIDKNVKLFLPKGNYEHFKGTIEINAQASGVGAHNWSWAVSQSWCSGAGTNEDPYLIENLSVDAMESGSPFSIINSQSVHFMVNNCEFHNGTREYPYVGLMLSNCANGTIQNTNIYDNHFSLDILSCDDMIINNVTTKHSHIGIRSNEGSNLDIINSYVENCTQYGIRLERTLDCYIFNNTVYNNTEGISPSRIQLQNRKIKEFLLVRDLTIPLERTKFLNVQREYMCFLKIIFTCSIIRSAKLRVMHYISVLCLTPLLKRMKSLTLIGASIFLEGKISHCMITSPNGVTIVLYEYLER